MVDTKHRFDCSLAAQKKPPIHTLEAKLARYPYAAARLDADGRVLKTCQHDHGRSEAAAIACHGD